MKKITIYENSGCNVISLDSLLTTILFFWYLKHYTEIHTAICLVLSIVFFIVFLGIYCTKIGFFILSLLYSGTVAMIAGALTLDITKGDWIWTIVIGGLVFIFSLIWHVVSLHDSGADYEAYVE